MGCDIHIALEKKVDDKWVMVNRLHHSTRATDRNYKRFSDLCGVRGDLDGSDPEPKGVPQDVSESTKLFIDEWKGDGHSHSWEPLERAFQIFLDTEYDKNYDEGDDEWLLESYFGLHLHEETEGIKDYRIVFFFDN